jgi:amidophosphoribosyltransferase
METGRVYSLRWKLGEQLADEWKRRGFGADVVVAVPDTSRPAATGMAYRLGVPNQEGFIKNRYSGRTFIMPDQAAREATLRFKLNPIEEIFRDQRVVLVDDSIVRGTTMRRIVQLVRKMKPKELHIAIFSPPVRNPCFYGIDMPSRDELVAAAYTPEQLQDELAKRLNADSVTFLSQEGVANVAGNDICAACFTGRYPVALTAEERSFILKDRRSA